MPDQCRNKKAWILTFNSVQQWRVMPASDTPAWLAQALVKTASEPFSNPTYCLPFHNCRSQECSLIHLLLPNLKLISEIQPVTVGVSLGLRMEMMEWDLGIGLSAIWLVTKTPSITGGEGHVDSPRQKIPVQWLKHSQDTPILRICYYLLTEP